MKTSLFLPFFFCAICISTVGSVPLQAEVKISEGQKIDQSAPGAVYFTPPPGWHLADKSSLPRNVQIMVVGKGKRNFPPSINLATETYPGTLKAYLQLVKSINDAKGNVWKDLGKIQTQAGEASLSQVDAKIQGEEVRMMHTILLKNGIVYILTATAIKEEFPSFYKPFFDAMSSLHINEVSLENTKKLL